VALTRVALHLRAARDRQRLEALASVDSLTGIANRRQFDAVLAAECRRALRTGQPVAVGMIDVDYFKRYNDSYGHAQGDRALRAVADVLRSGMRRTGDLAARYGGEESALVMVDISHATDLMDSLWRYAPPYTPYLFVTRRLGTTRLAHKRWRRSLLPHSRRPLGSRCGLLRRC
jgi:GGDEF domain-containing protein